MTTVHHAHQRPSPNGKKHVAKGFRTSLTSRTTSSPKLPGISEIKAVKEEVHEAVGPYDENEDDSDGMAVSFLQFCTSCDKQILVPNNSLLYCSEICRRRDANRLSIRDSVFGGYTREHAKGDLDEERVDVRTIVPPHQPTARPPISIRIPQKSHDGKSDLDPTEWKPAEPDHGQVLQYFNKLHRSSSTLASNKSGRQAVEFRGNTSVINTTPSLSHTPTASDSSKESSFAATPYEFIPRDAQCIAPATSNSNEGSDFAMPPTVPSILASFSVQDRKAKASIKVPAKNGNTDADIPRVMAYDKKILGPATPAKGSLKMLFGDRGEM